MFGSLFGFAAKAANQFVQGAVKGYKDFNRNLSSAAKGFNKMNSGGSGFGGGSADGFSSGQFYYQKYNDVTYKLEVWLDNSGNFDQVAKKIYPINPASITNLYFSNILNTWNTEGTMTFMYAIEDANAPSDGSEQSSSVLGAQQNTEVLKTYQFRGDGYDLLRFAAVPMIEETQGLKAPVLPISENDPNWILSHLFSIYDIEDVNEVPGLKGPVASYLKCLKLYFHDARYQFLRSTNIEYSTALSPKADFNSQMANEGVLETGEAIIEIWNQSIGNPNIGGSQEFTIQYDQENWDLGSGKIFYTSPAAFSALEDIEYVFKHHTSKEPMKGVNGVNEMCVLSTNRAKTFSKLEDLCIKPLSKYFKEALEGSQPGKLQLEHFFVTSHTEDEDKKNIASSSLKAPVAGPDQTDRDLKTFKYGQIISYSFVDMSPEINSSMFSTIPVYSVDIGKRTFDTKFSNNDADTARRAIGDTYINELYKQGSDNSRLFLPTIHKNKKSASIFPRFTLNGDQIPNGDFLRQKSGIHDILYTGLFQNTCICFKTFGLSLRRPGSFIGIDKTGGASDTDYNNKLYGQWFVIKVDHSFEAGAYMNAIYAVKIHRFKEQETSFAETI